MIKQLYYKKQKLELIQIISNFNLSKVDQGQHKYDFIKACMLDQNSLHFSQTHIIGFIQRLNYLIVARKNHLNNLPHISFRLCYLENWIMKICTHHWKTIIIRYFCKLNEINKKIKLIINPKSGEIYIQTTVIFLESKYPQQQILQIFSVIFNKLRQYTLKDFKSIKRLDQKQKFIQSDLNQHLDSLKVMIKTSPHYAWNIFKQSTNMKKQKKVQYHELRKNFENNRKIYPIHGIIDEIHKTYNFSLKQNSLINYFSVKQQTHLKQQYLAKLNSSKKSQLITEITLTKQNLDKLFDQQLTKIDSIQGKIQLSLISYPPQNQEALRYQKQILRKLPNQQYIGLLRYYEIKNYKAETQNCVITNLVSGLMYYEFLNNNKQTISIFTKTHLLHQINLVVKYLSNNNIVYHNLDFKKIYVRKGLYIKVTDFSNAYHSEVKIANFKNHNPYKSLLPYVSNYQAIINESFGDEKADVFSIGMVIYETLHGKTPFSYKKNNQDDSTWFKKLILPTLIGVEKKEYESEQILQLLTYFCYECTHHEQINRDKIDQDQREKKLKYLEKIINVKARPYLDWVVIIFKYIHELYRKIYC